MGGLFGVVSKEDCVLDLFYGVDYHSHLGTRRAGMATYGERGFRRAIHNIENTPFRTKFGKDADEMTGYIGIGCISDYEPQPLFIQSHLGSFAITTVGKISNEAEVLKTIYENGHTHFQEMSGGKINATELVASLICKKPSIVEGIQYVQELVKGSMTLLVMTNEGIYAARDLYGRTPLVIGKNAKGFSVSFEDFAFMNLGYVHYKELGAGEIDFITADGVTILVEPKKEKKVCSFLWVYYGYPTSSYEGVNVEEMRYKCGSLMAKHDCLDNIVPDMVAGVPDSGIAHAIGYSNESGVPYARPFIKYTPTWARSFMPTSQAQRNLVAKRKLIPVTSLIENKSLLLIDDSIVRGTQLRETTEFLYNSGAKEVHVRPACPPLLYACKYLNFSRSNSELDLVSRRIIKDFEGEVNDEIISEYVIPNSPKYNAMVEALRQKQKFTSLRYHSLEDLVESIGLKPCELCTYCFTGKD